ncbi:unnamed protein product [Pedinophyceae sp. YPF-701]|nr:unnamed protein product [Pedinophyceae sp. YPF-701]
MKQGSILNFFGASASKRSQSSPVGAPNLTPGARVPAEPRKDGTPATVPSGDPVASSGPARKRDASPLDSEPASKRLATQAESPVGAETEPFAARIDAARTDGDPQRRRRMQELVGAGASTRLERRAEAVRQKFDWLAPSKVMDAARRRPGDAAFDERSVYVPQAAWSGLSESQRQYWKVKAQHRDLVLFFKVGKFFELYEDDAATGADVMGWKLTLSGVGKCRQVGCPESGLVEAARRLVAAGYKVGIMEQVETASAAKAARGSKAVVRRELTQVYTPATALDTEGGAAGGGGVVPSCVLCMWEAPLPREREGAVEVGVAVLDATSGQVYAGSVRELGGGRAAVGALLASVAPREVIASREGLSTHTARVLALHPARKSWVPCGAGPNDLPRPDDAAAAVVERLRGVGVQVADGAELPGCLAECDGPTLSAVSGLLAHLRRVKLAGAAQFASNVLPLAQMPGGGLGSMVLDGPTLTGLNILDGPEGRVATGTGPPASLLALVDSCATAGGRRTLRAWLCAPLTDPAAIDARLDVVEALVADPATSGTVRQRLTRAPDTAALVGRLRRACAEPSAGLPYDIRRGAQSRRLGILRGACAGLARALDIVSDLRQDAAALERLDGTRRDPPALLQSLLDQPGARDELDTAAALLAEILRAVPAPTGKAKQDAGVAVSASVLEGAGLAADADDEGRLEAEVKLTTRWAETLVGWGCEGPPGGVSALAGGLWERVDASLSAIDALLSFAAFAGCADGAVCRPEVLPVSGDHGHPLLDLRGMWNPLVRTPGSGTVVPNDVALGGPTGARVAVITGSNMSGKSTAMRAACLVAVLAQAGCYVPASAARLSACDRIFTRVGAQDEIMAGRSTFLVECLETAAVLKDATAGSLVVLDELGRGTSTHDGHAIAEAVLARLARGAVRPRVLFSTHYHALATGPMAADAGVALVHMASERDGRGGLRFSYKLQAGVAPQSCGYEVAAMAGVPAAVVARARAVGERVEEEWAAAQGVRQILRAARGAESSNV